MCVCVCTRASRANRFGHIDNHDSFTTRAAWPTPPSLLLAWWSQTVLKFRLKLTVWRRAFATNKSEKMADNGQQEQGEGEKEKEKEKEVVEESAQHRSAVAAKNPDKVVILAKNVANAPILKTTQFSASASHPFSKVIQHIQVSTQTHTHTHKLHKHSTPRSTFSSSFVHMHAHTNKRNTQNTRCEYKQETQTPTKRAHKHTRTHDTGFIKNYSFSGAFWC
jgi:hypothetical protein